MTVRITNTVNITLQGDWSDRVEFVGIVNDIPLGATVVSVDYSTEFNATVIIFKYSLERAF